MRAHRAFVSKLESVVKLSGSEAAHLRVLRANVGDLVTLFDGAGLEADAKILTLEDFSITLEVAETRVVNLEPPQEITLAIALLKGDKLSEVVRAATELGVSRFQLLVDRTRGCQRNWCSETRAFAACGARSQQAMPPRRHPTRALPY